jgi:glycosyltransferase involved in cell wall biosynthesis
MTYSNQNNFELPKLSQHNAPRELKPEDISVVIPVRNNAQGLQELFLSITLNESLHKLCEIIIVDDGSKDPVTLESIQKINQILPVHLSHTKGIGPGGARNKGVSQAIGSWILFVDSDCLPTNNMLSGYIKAMDGSIGYTGNIKARGDTLLSRFYDSQRVLTPFGIDEYGSPQHVVTANTLVWKSTFQMIRGFDESFYLSAGEDVDIGFRLRQVGRLKYVPNAILVHDYGGISAFVDRFFRYGRANAMLEKKYSVSFKPQKSIVNEPNIINNIVVLLQYLITLYGYKLEKMKL